MSGGIMGRRRWSVDRSLLVCMASIGLGLTVMLATASADEASSLSTSSSLTETSQATQSTGLTGSEALAAEEARAPKAGYAGTTGEAGGESAGSLTEAATPSSSPSGWSLSLAGDPLLIGGALTEAELLQAQEEARLASPEAVLAREASQTAYESLSASESEALASVFPGLIQEPAGGPPRLPAGGRIASFSSDFSAALELPGGKHGALQSVAPIAVDTAAGRVAVDVTPRQAGSGFEAARPAAGMSVRVGGRLGEGVSLPDVGVTLTPVTEGGTPLEAGGVIDSQAVFYGDSEDPQAGVRDVDSLVKIGTYQFSEETILRSESSPSTLYFRVGLPEGASLVQEGSGPALVMDAGRVLATIMVPGARDVEGTVVRGVSMSVSGDTIVVSVPHSSDEYRMPLEVDPTVSEGQSMGRYQMGHNWWFYANSPGNVFTNYEPKYGVYGMEDHDPYSVHYKPGEYGLFGYETQGESRIYEFVSESYDNNPSTVSSTVYIGGPGGLEGTVHNAEWTPTTVCVAEGCPALIGEKQNWANGAFYKQAALAEEWWSFEDLLRSATVYIVQEKGPSVTSGACGMVWTKTSVCNVELSATDPGLGINEYTVSSPNAAEWGTKNKICTTGLPCSQHVTSSVKLTGLPEGEDTIKATAQDPVGLSATAERAAKIDNLAPHNITLSGLPTSKEIGAGEYKLKAEATDGEGATRSSGIMWIALLIDGREVGSHSGSCLLGPCSAHGEWTIFGREYGTGHHTITVVAADNAGNSATERFTMIVHPASPVALGPGSANPQSGEFMLQATDVSMGGGLSVSRSYTSRHLMTGAEGPLSAQWGFALGGSETLVKQADGSMVLTDASGAQTSFASEGKGGFISPLGDSNLTLSSTSCKSGQTEYMLRNAAAATTTCFAVPSGGSGEVWTPSIAEGPVATDTVTYAYRTTKSAEYALASESGPDQITSGPDGNLWFTETYYGNKVGKITPSGVITQYAMPAGSWPQGIAAGPDGNLWFTESGTNKIAKITTSGGVTEYAVPAGSSPYRIVAGPDGNLWFTNNGTGKIGKITTGGVITEYALPTGSGLSGITKGPDSNLWFTEPNAHKVGKITTSGGITEYALPAGGSANEITSGPDGNLWFTNEPANRIGKITTAGQVTEYQVQIENEWQTGTVGIVTGSDNNLWFTDREGYVGKITTSGVVTKYPVPAGSGPWGVTSGPDGNIWYTDINGNKIAMMMALGPVTEPTEALAPVPAGVSCSPELKPGCRALTFNYASSTTATGENSSEWGDYAGHLTRVYYTAYDPASKAMKAVEVAHYLYDKQARLRSEWDPRVSPALKTTYGYDTEGHVTALTAPGQESWAITYGMIGSDGGSGRVLKVTQAPASAALWAGTGPKSTVAPVISGSAVLGVRMAVSNGSWSGSPVSYAYQWEDCNIFGSECKPILGATNPNYTPVSSDLGHTLVAQVSATNGGGSVIAASAASAVVASTAPGAPPNYTQTIDSPNSLNAVSCIPGTTDCVVSDSLGKAFYATNVSTGVAATWNSWNGPGTSPSEAVSCPTTSLCLLAAGSKEGGGNMYYASSLGGAWTEAYSPVYGVDAISCPSPSFCVDGQDNWGYFRYSTSPASTAWNLEEQGGAPMKGVYCLSSSFCAIADSVGTVHVANTTSQVESSSWTATNVDGTSALNGIACTSTTSCVAVDGAGNVLNLTIASNGAATVSKHDIDGSYSLTAVTCTGTICVTVDNVLGDVFVSVNGGETWIRQYQLGLGDKLTSVSCASASLCVAADTAGKVTAFDPSLTQSVDGSNSLNAVSCISGTTDCVVSDSLGKAFYATNVSASAAASWKAWSGPGASPSEAVDCPTTSLCLLAAGSANGYGGNLYYASALGGAWTLAYSPGNGVDAISCPSSSFCVDGQDAYGSFRYSTNPASTLWEYEAQGSATTAMKSVFCLSASFCAIADSAGSVHIATTTTQVESSAWTETNVDGMTALNGVACTSTTSCVAVDGAGNVLNLTIAGNGAATVTKQNIDSTNSLTAVTCVSSTCVTVDNHGNIFVSTNSGANWGKQYAIGTNFTSVSCASSSLCVAADTTGDITAFNPTGAVKEGESRAPQPGSTVEYGVPLSGSGLPTMTSGEVEKWGQKDLPTEATAIFPPDEPQGWPASSYKRATIYYRDGTSRTVNVDTPGGAISTSEYNEQNDVIRSLSADNRAAALKEAKPAEAAKLLDTQSTYNSEGTELLSTLGPRHAIKLANGKEVQARSHTVYSYDEGAPSEGGPYRLVTKTTQGAQIEGEAEQDIRTTVTSYSGQNSLGWELREPTSTIVDPSGAKLARTTVYSASTGNVTESTTPTGAAENPPFAFAAQFGSNGTGNGQFVEPRGIAIDSKGNIWVVDCKNNRVQEFSSAGAYLGQFGGTGTGNGQFNEPRSIAIDPKGDLWVTDMGNERVQEFSSTGTYMSQFGSEGTGNGQFKSPRGITTDSTGNVWVTDTLNNRVQEFSSAGAYLRQFGASGTGNGQFKEPKGIAIDSKGNVWVTDTANNRVQEFSPTGIYISQFGSGTLTSPWGIVIDSKGDLWVANAPQSEVIEFSPAGVQLSEFGSAGTGTGQFKEASELAFDSNGALWVTDTGNARVQKWVSNSGGPHTTQTIYYTTEANAKYPTCGGHPEWANLPCQTQPAKQPETSGLPSLPVRTITSYNMYGEPTRTTSTVGSNTRTTTATYDEAGRTLSSETSSTVGQPLPAVTDKYSEVTGALIEQSTTSAGVTQAIKSTFNNLGQLTNYTDAGGNTTKYEYESERDARLLHVDDGKGSQTYTYDATTGAVTKLIDSQGANQLTFTASYDVEGNMTSESYPNGMNANFTRNPVGDTTGLSYVKTTNCSVNCTWFSDTVVPSIHGQWLSQQSTLASDSYTYDQAGRLTQTQETPAGEGCTTRLYGYDEETNRTSLTTRPPGSGGACSGEGGTVEGHTYDTANRLTDQGVAYEPFGETAKLSAADAGGSELQSTFYADGQLHEQSQNGQSVGYALDPARRPGETVDTGTVNSTYVSHYPGGGGSPSWTVEPTSGHWTRYVSGIGGFAAVETDSEAPVLQLDDLQGNIVASASCSETATKLLSTERHTEYGVPTSSKPAKYGWLGGGLTPTELPSGVVAMGARSYIPQLGRFLQTDPVPGGSANAYAYVFGDPVNSSDPSGEDANGPSAWAIELAGELTGQEVAAYEQAKREEAERKAAEAAAAAAAYAALEAATAIPTEGGVEEAEEWSDPVAHAADAENEYLCFAYTNGIKEYKGNILMAVGEAECSQVVGELQVQICIQVYVRVHGGHGRWHNWKCQPNTKLARRQIKQNVAAKCAPGSVYRAWAWGWSSTPGYIRTQAMTPDISETHRCG